MKIDSKFRHEAVVKTPVHLGYNIEERSIKTMDRITGKIHTQVVQTSKPILGVVNTVREVETPHTTEVDLRTNRVTSNDPIVKVKVGLNPIPEYRK